MNTTWLCQKCSKNQDVSSTIAGIEKKCEWCGLYAYSYYQQTPQGWMLKTIQEIILTNMSHNTMSQNVFKHCPDTTPPKERGVYPSVGDRGL